MHSAASSVWSYEEWQQSWRESSMRRRGEDDGPSLGVREPRTPKPQAPSTGAAVQPPRDDYRETEALAASPRVVVSAPNT